MLLSKYANHSAGSSFNRPTHQKRPRSPSADMFSRYTKPSGPRAQFPGEYTQSVWDRLDYSYNGRLNIGDYQSAGQNMRPSGNYPSVRVHLGGSYPSEKMWPSRFHPTDFHPSGFHPSEFHPSDIHPSGFHQSKTVCPSGNFMHLESRKEWHVKSPSVAAVESGKGKDKMDADSLILGTETFAIQQPIVHSKPTEPILSIAPK